MSDIQNGSSPAPRSPLENNLRHLMAGMSDPDPIRARRAQAGFYNALYDYLVRTRLARSLDVASFNDVFQVTILAVWDALPTFREESAISTFAYGIFRHKVADLLRGAHAQRSESLADDDLAQLASSERDVGDALSRQQVQQFLLACLDKLRKKSGSRAAAIHFVRLGYSTTEIAVSLEAPVGTVKRWLHEARLELAACIRRQGARTSKG